MKHLFKKQDLTLEQKMLQGIIFTCYLILTTIKFFFIDNILEFKNIKTAYNIFELIFFAILIVFSIKHKLIDKFALLFYTSIALILTTIVFLRK